MERIIVYTMLIINMVVAIRFMIRYKCEIPFFLAIFNVMVEYRLISLLLGYAQWVEFDYGIAFKFNFDLAYIVSDLIMLGTTTMLYCFIYYYKKAPKKFLHDNEDYLRAYVMSKKRMIIIGLVIFTIVQLAVSKSNTGAYAFFVRLGNNSFIILLFMVILYSDKRKPGVKAFYILLFCVMGYLTYNAYLRFQFLGWMIPIAFYMTRNIKPQKKAVYLLVGIFCMIFIFSLAGVLRYKTYKNSSASVIVGQGLQRMLIADDVNFIDGFIMMYQIYPDRLPYDYGLEHLEVILRPIPRALWPNKPLAGWFQNYAAKHNGVKTTIGFSPTIWGVFYAEMGVVGVIIFSVLWAWMLAKFYVSFRGYASSLWGILVGIMLAAMIPVFRSGDLAGDIAIVLLSYWPIILFIRGYRKFVKRVQVVKMYQSLAAA